MAPDDTAPPKKRAARSWEALNLPSWCLEAVSSMGYREPTPTQTAAIPLFLGNSDVVVEAPTGSGKSVAFLLPLLARVLRQPEPAKRGHVAAIVLSPTRELATQIHRVLLELVAFHAPSAELLPYLKSTDEKRPAAPEGGGTFVVPQLLVGGTTKPAADLSFFVRHSPNVLVATPGRLAELLASPHVNSSSQFEMLVLDEADRLLDLGFSRELQRILAFLPKQRRTGLFSASVSEALGELIRVNLRNPRRVVVTVKAVKAKKSGSNDDDESAAAAPVIEDKKTPASLQMAYLVLPSSHKLPALLQLLERLEPRPLRTLVFLASCASVKYFARVLPPLMPAGFSAMSLHGQLDPGVRERSWARFLAASSPCVLLTTDVASRGLDVPVLDLVVNIDPPSDPKTFIHRCGRAGRAGRKGLAVAMLRPGREEDYVPFMQVRRTPIAPLAHPAIAVAPAQAAAATEAMRAQARADREVHLLAQRAFVSWVRSFQEHRAASIFRVADLDWADLAAAWGLLRLPRMPELKGRADVDRSLGLGLDVDAIPFKDKAKERKRQEEMAEFAEKKRKEAAAAATAAMSAAGGDGDEDGAAAGAKRKKNDAWSAKHDREDLRAARRDKKRRRREADRAARMTDQEREDQRRLDELLAEVRRRNEEAAAAAAGADGEDEFGGFDD